MYQDRMGSTREAFWEKGSFVVVGDSGGKGFPRLTYRGLKRLGKTVYPVDPSAAEIEGDPTFPDLSGLPGPVEGAVLELDRKETRGWLEQVADAGITDVWIHMRCESEEALALAQERGLNVLTGTCAVMYVTPGFSLHAIHRGIVKLLGKY